MTINLQTHGPAMTAIAGLINASSTAMSKLYSVNANLFGAAITVDPEELEVYDTLESADTALDLIDARFENLFDEISLADGPTPESLDIEKLAEHLKQAGVLSENSNVAAMLKQVGISGAFTEVRGKYQAVRTTVKNFARNIDIDPDADLAQDFQDNGVNNVMTFKPPLDAAIRQATVADQQLSDIADILTYAWYVHESGKSIENILPLGESRAKQKTVAA